MDARGLRSLAPTLCLLLASLHIVAVWAAADCEALGFTGLSLCSDCDVLAQHVKDAELEKECRSCCTQDDETAQRTYASAVLEVCMRRVVFYPHVAEFIRDRLPSFTNLNVRYRAQATPKLLMKDADGQVQDTVMIDSWKQEHIEAFLKEKLPAASL